MKMKLLSRQQSVTTTLLLTLGSLQLELIPKMVVNAQQQNQIIRTRLIDKCCQVGKERAIESSKFNCKLSAREALLDNININTNHNHHLSGRSGFTALSMAAAESMLIRDASLSDQCEMVLESCCMAHHRNKNCDSGKQFAKSGSSCMDVELSKEVTIATESFNDCCMSCSLGILAAKNPSQNETSPSLANNSNNNRLNANNFASRCKLLSPLASSLSGQLYEQTYIECCQENLPRVSGALLEPGAQLDCLQSNPCSQRCVTANSFTGVKRDRCDCFSGYRLASDGISCLDVDECKLNTHTCNKQTEICDNTRGSFRCLARDFIPNGGNSNDENQDNSDKRDFDSTTSDSFSPLRLCPFGFKWNQQENRCLQSSLQESFVLSAANQNQAAQRSASLVYAPSNQNNNNNQPLARIISSSWT